MESEPPSLVPGAHSRPPQPGSAAYRTSSAPTTSVAPPPISPGLLWPSLRTLLSSGMLAARSALVTGGGATTSSALLDLASCAGVALLLVGVPMLLPRYRSFASLSWRLFVVCFVELYASYSRASG